VATQLLQKASSSHPSARLTKVISLLQAGNPFTTILEQIDKLVKQLDEEQQVDDNEKAWCEKTTNEQTNYLDNKADELNTIQDDIKKLKTEIDDPSSGLKAQIATAQESLKTNLENQAEETKTRRADNLEYQKDVGTMSDAISLITEAKQILTDYYDSVDNEQLGLMQEEPKAPETWKGSYKGQNEQAKTVLKLMDDIKMSTTKEQSTAHENEAKAQSDYEDSMEALTKEESELQESIAKLNKELTTKEKELQTKYEDETATEREKIAIERYIEKIKPGCDFVTGKYEDRKTARSAEKNALEGAKTKLEESPKFKLAQLKDKKDGWGDCKGKCLKDESDVECKACLAGISVPGYCAAHKDAKGC
jgi:DNA repair exonuclease SbcCD ATPase subunit